MIKKLPKIYLDQNILQYDFEGKITIPNNDQVQYVYSDEHFNEITRWKNDGYFDVLKRLNARKIKCSLDSNNNFTDNGILLDYVDPKIMFEEYKDTINDSKSAMNLFQPLQVFLNGNTTVTNPEEINQNFQNTLKDLLGDTLKKIGNTEMTTQYNAYVEAIGGQLEHALKNQKVSPLEEARKKITKEILSNLDPNNGLIIDQIWNLIKDVMEDIEKDQFFGKRSFSFQNDFVYSKFKNVIHCHSVLNYLGYWPDGGLVKMSKIYGINSDASHLAHSIFCEGIMSGDKRMCKKAQAIFSYLDLRTEVYQLEFGQTETKQPTHNG